MLPSQHCQYPLINLGWEGYVQVPCSTTGCSWFLNIISWIGGCSWKYQIQMQPLILLGPWELLRLFTPLHHTMLPPHHTHISLFFCPLNYPKSPLLPHPTTPHIRSSLLLPVSQFVIWNELPTNSTRHIFLLKRWRCNIILFSFSKYWRCINQRALFPKCTVASAMKWSIMTYRGFQAPDKTLHMKINILNWVTIYAHSAKF